MNGKIKIAGLFLLCAAFAFDVQAGGNDFDLICGYFEKLDKLPGVDAMSTVERDDFILDKIAHQLPEASGARAAWVAIDSAVAEQRYELFQSAAESTLNTPWQCAAMKKWASRTGDF